MRRIRSMPLFCFSYLHYPESRTRANVECEKHADFRKKTIEQWKGKPLTLVDSAASFDQIVEPGQLKEMLISSARTVQRLQVRGCLPF